MAELNLTEISPASIATPSAGVLAAFAGLDKVLRTKDENGYIRGLLNNFSVAQQAPAATTRTYLAGSALAVPPSKLQIGTMFRWSFDLTKTAAGSAASTFDICFGTAGTTADAARVSFTKPGGSAAADVGRVVITATVRGPLSGAGIVVGNFQLTHNLESTGHALIPCVNAVTVSSGFDVTVANLIVGVCITTGASDVITIEQVMAEAMNI